MPKAMVMTCTCATEDEALQLSQVLVQERLAACVQRLSGLRSTYVWQGRLHDEAEVLLIIKTKPELYPRVESRIRALHSYEVPEIVGWTVDAVSEDYLAWLNASTC